MVFSLMIKKNIKKLCYLEKNVYICGVILHKNNQLIIMEIKKSPKANLEDKRFMFVLMGLVAALCILYTAFEWNQQEITVHEAENEDFLIEEEIQTLGVD